MQDVIEVHMKPSEAKAVDRQLHRAAWELRQYAIRRYGHDLVAALTGEPEGLGTDYEGEAQDE
jgi:hypothetical protein